MTALHVGPAAPTHGGSAGGEQTLALTVPAELVDVLAERVAQLLQARAPVPEGDPWLDVDAAAAYLSCRPKRIYDLRSQGRVRFAKDGSRLLFRRSWLDACLEQEAA